MSSKDVAIAVRGLSKSYTIGHNAVKHASLGEALMERVKNPFQRSQKELFWALKDIEFDINKGDVVGIIGRNGAGKSTLLKILSQITEPTLGEARLYGRVGSLLEVGTGFHPELTGRENIYLNGAILGMRRSEIERQFDPIVDFAEIEQFLDTPVKRYSSGMYIRLAFAVAAHLNPEILIVDEVLAVGDAQFQKKCLGKMQDVSHKGGKTVLFVSHNLGAISYLCTKGIALESGTIGKIGSSQEAIEFYNHSGLEQSVRDNNLPPHVLYYRPENVDNYDFCITKIEILDTSGLPKPIVEIWDSVVLRFTYFCKRNVAKGSVNIEIVSSDGAKLLTLSTQPDGTLPLSFQIGEGTVDCTIDSMPLAAGDYTLVPGLAIPWVEFLWQCQETVKLTVTPNDVYNSGLVPSAPRSLIATSHSWSVSNSKE